MRPGMHSHSHLNQAYNVVVDDGDECDDRVMVSVRMCANEDYILMLLHWLLLQPLHWVNRFVTHDDDSMHDYGHVHAHDR